MTYATAYTKIKEKLSEFNFKSNTDNFAIQVNLTNKDCSGILYIQSKDGNLYCEPYDYYDNDAVLSLTLGDLIKLIEKKLTLKDGIEKGRIEVCGSCDTVECLISALSQKEEKAEKKPIKKSEVKTESKTACKKPSSKKTVK